MRPFLSFCLASISFTICVMAVSQVERWRLYFLFRFRGKENGQFS